MDYLDVKDFWHVVALFTVSGDDFLETVINQSKVRNNQPEVWFRFKNRQDNIQKLDDYDKFRLRYDRNTFNANASKVKNIILSFKYDN
jgi:hypothetical protein